MTKKKVGMKKKKSWIRASRIGWRRKDKEVVTKKTKQTNKKKRKHCPELRYWQGGVTVCERAQVREAGDGDQ